MNIIIILIILLLLFGVGAAPVWPHAQNWGYGPSGIIGAILVIVLIVWLFRGGF